jgi:hypothetical protein
MDLSLDDSVSCLCLTDLAAIELKLLRLLSVEPTKLEGLKPNPKTSRSACETMCVRLAARGWLELESEIVRVAITRKGLFLLDRDLASRSVTPDEFLLLRSLEKKVLGLDEMAAKVPLADRPRLIRELADRGFVRITKTQVVAVWLTEAGRDCLSSDD